MPTNVEWLEQIHTRLGEMQTFDQAVGIDLVTRIANIETLINGTNNRLNTIESRLTALWVGMNNTYANDENGWAKLREVQDLILTTLEGLNSNNSVNAQNSQNIALSAVPCCPGPELTDNIPLDLCQRAQALVTRVMQIIGNICTYGGSGLLPPAPVFKKHYTMPDWDIQTPVKISDSEIVNIQSYIASFGANTLGQLCDATTSDLLFASLVNTINSSGSAYEAINRLQSGDYNASEVPEAYRDIIGQFFTATIVNFAFQAGSTMGQEAFDENYCGDIPDPEPTPTYTDRHDRVVDDSPGSETDAGFLFTPTQEAQPGWTFEICYVPGGIDPFPGATVRILPSLALVGRIDSDNYCVGWVIQEGDTGARIEWDAAPEGQNYFVTYDRKAYEPE